MYSVPNTFTPNTVISSTQVNNNFSDAGQALTDSLDRLGRGGMQANLDMATFRVINAGAPASGTDLITRNWWQAPTVPITGPLTISGALTATGALTLNGALTTDNSTADEVGFKGIPQNSQTAGNYTCVLADASRHIYGNSGFTYTIPSNASVPYPIGTILTFVNGGAGNCTIAINSDTMRLSGSGLTGSRTLALLGSASALKVASTEWIISGTGLS